MTSQEPIDVKTETQNPERDFSGNSGEEYESNRGTGSAPGPVSPEKFGMTLEEAFARTDKRTEHNTSKSAEWDADD